MTEIMATTNNDIKKERKLPIFEDYEIVENGKAVQKWMLSLNGMYISGISKEQLRMLFFAAMKEYIPDAKKQMENWLADYEKKKASSK